jgi:hypothetical protein
MNKKKKFIEEQLIKVTNKVTEKHKLNVYYSLIDIEEVLKRMIEIEKLDNLYKNNL